MIDVRIHILPDIGDGDGTPLIRLFPVRPKGNFVHVIANLKLNIRRLEK
jgi:hypothetical protein